METVAIQQARQLADNLVRLSHHNNNLKPFHYHDLGSMATLGRNKAVADIGKVHSQGFMAWLLWLIVHLRSILGVKNKLTVMLSWAWQYFSYAGSIRNIVYATKPKIIIERIKREASTHLGTDMMEDEEKEKE